MGNWRDHERDMSRYFYQDKKANERQKARMAKLPPIGSTDPESGKLIVGYTSNAGRMGKYLLLRETEKKNMLGGIVKWCKLGMIGGKLLPDGKDGFEVTSDRVIWAEAAPEGPEARSVFDEEEAGK